MRVLGAIVTAVGGGFAALVTIALGHCSAFGGGDCPSEGLEGDIIGGVGIGLALAIGGPMIAWRPDRVGVIRALIVGGTVGLLVALAVEPAMTGG